MFNNFFFFENRGVYEIIWKNKVQPGMSKMTIQYSACALFAGQLRLQTHSEYIILIVSPRQKMFTQTRLNATLYENCLSCL
jgi:hypothetical protein